MMPVQIYPMFETAIRARSRTDAGRSICSKISELWSRFSSVAARQPVRLVASGADGGGDPHADADEPDGRPAVHEVHELQQRRRHGGGGHHVLGREGRSRSACRGIAGCSSTPGTDCHEHQFVSNRWSFAETPAIELGGRRVLELAGLRIDDIALVDLYSCFPSAVQLGAQSLGLALDRQLTRTGGLSFAGGPWNNYVMHAIATMVADLRDRSRASVAWCGPTAATSPSTRSASTRPSRPLNGFRHDHPQAEIDALPQRELATPVDAAGPATIEAYTVMHSRDGEPETAIAACLLADGRRAWGMSTDAGLAAAMCDGEWVGTPVTLTGSGTLTI